MGSGICQFLQKSPLALKIYNPLVLIAVSLHAQTGADLELKAAIGRGDKPQGFPCLSTHAILRWCCPAVGFVLVFVGVVVVFAFGPVFVATTRDLSDVSDEAPVSEQDGQSWQKKKRLGSNREVYCVSCMVKISSSPPMKGLCATLRCLVGNRWGFTWRQINSNSRNGQGLFSFRACFKTRGILVRMQKRGGPSVDDSVV